MMSIVSFNSTSLIFFSIKQFDNLQSQCITLFIFIRTAILSYSGACFMNHFSHTTRGSKRNMAVPRLSRPTPLTTLTEVNNIDILRVDLRGISVTSVYKPPGEPFSFHQPSTAVGDQPQVIIGDFNRHSPMWGYATMNTDGELVEDWAKKHTASLINDPKHPYSNSGRWHNIGIILSYNRIGCCNKIVMEPVPQFQH